MPICRECEDEVDERAREGLEVAPISAGGEGEVGVHEERPVQQRLAHDITLFARESRLSWLSWLPWPVVEERLFEATTHIDADKSV